MWPTILQSLLLPLLLPLLFSTLLSILMSVLLSVLLSFCAVGGALGGIFGTPAVPVPVPSALVGPFALVCAAGLVGYGLLNGRRRTGGKPRRPFQSRWRRVMCASSGRRSRRRRLRIVVVMSRGRWGKWPRGRRWLGRDSGIRLGRVRTGEGWWWWRSPSWVELRWRPWRCIGMRILRRLCVLGWLAVLRRGRDGLRIVAEWWWRRRRRRHGVASGKLRRDRERGMRGVGMMGRRGRGDGRREGRGHAVPCRRWWHLPWGRWVAGDDGALFVVGWRAALRRVRLFVVL